MRAPALLPLAAALALLLPAPASAIDPVEAAKISVEIEEKETAVRKDYGDRSLRELSHEERKELEARLRAAREEVLQRHGTDAKGFAVGLLKLGRDGHKVMEQAKKDYREARAAEVGKPAETKAGGGEVTVQRGFGDDNPVVLEDVGGVQVQRGGAGGIEIPLPQGTRPRSGHSAP